MIAQRRVFFPVLLTIVCTLLGCGGDTAPSDDQRAEGGTVVIALAAEPATLLPPLVGSDHEQAIVEVVYDRLADIGPALGTVGDAGFTPRLASAWQWAADSMSIAFTLQPSARWHDGAIVTSADVRRSFALYTDPRAESRNAQLLANIDSVSTPDPQTATFWFKRRSPQQFYDAVHHLFVMPAHLLVNVDLTQLATVPLARSPVGTGRFAFVGWTSGQRIELRSDTSNYRGRAMLDRVYFVPTPDFGAATVKLFTGEADFFTPLNRESLEQALRTPSVRVWSYPALRYLHLAFNLRDPANRARPHPVLGDVAVRRALSMATNRERVVRTVFDSIGSVAIGPAPRALLPDESLLRPIPYDVDGARALLDSAGWVLSPTDSVRSRGGVRLRIEVLVPSVSLNRDRMAVLLQDQLRMVGAEVVLQRLEPNALVKRTSKGEFDSWMGGWNTSPGLVGLRQVWSTRAIGGEGDNTGGYSSSTFDANVDTALTAFDPIVARRAVNRAMQTIIDDAPAIWLVEEVSPSGMSSRIDPGVLPSTGWWHGLPDWRIPPSRRNDRDRAGLGTAN